MRTMKGQPTWRPRVMTASIRPNTRWVPPMQASSQVSTGCPKPAETRIPATISHSSEVQCHAKRATWRDSGRASTPLRLRTNGPISHASPSSECISAVARHATAAARNSSEPMSGSFGAPHHADDAGAPDFDQPKLAHQRDEAVDLGRITGQLEDEARGRRVDHLGAEHIGKAQCFDAVVALTG